MNFDNSFIYGKNPTKNVVAIEVKDSTCELFIETKDGIKVEVLPNEYWILYAEDYENDFIKLKGDAHYSYADKFETQLEYRAAIQKAKAKRWDIYTCYNAQEMFMLKNGVTLFKGMRPEDVSILSFDIETTTLAHNKDARVLLIANTFRKGKEIIRKVFNYENYKTQKEFIGAWADWVRECDPSILLGHNIFNFDIPYLNHCGGQLLLGRDGSRAYISSRTSQFRKDGSQSYDYKNCSVFGRQVIDTFHLSIKYDIARNYPSYKLKEIIAHEGLEVEGRQHYDASKIRENYTNKEEWEKIIKYAEHDADDALSLFDLMAPNFFYYTQSIPKTFQQIINGATGSQVNSFMIRSYLQEKYGIPKASDRVDYEGAISFGNPGVYKNVNKVDVASLYPSIILRDKIYDAKKDPNANFLKMVRYFTDERLSNKKRAKESGDRYFMDLEQSQKIFINSAYGFLGAPGLNFNCPYHAANITKAGREILQKGIKWAEVKGYQIINADTDSFSYTTGSKLSKEAFYVHILQLNGLYHSKIKWEDDGQYKTFIVVKAKNYILDDGKKVKIKGSSLKATMKEPALKRFIDDIIAKLLKNRKDELYDLYVDYANIINTISSDNINEWSSKKTITKAILNPERTNEQRVKDALKGKSVEEGDKIYIFFETEEKLTLVENFNGEYSKKKLFNKLYKTLEIFDTLIDVSVFPNFSLKRNEGRI